MDGGAAGGLPPELDARLAAADPAWAAWARRELADPPEAGPRIGQVFTPPRLAGLLAGCVDDADGVVLDPACGEGALLLAVLDRRLARGMPAARALAELEGWDLDPAAAWRCRRALVTRALDAGGPVPGTLRVFGGTDALASDGRPGALLARRAPFRRGVAAVIANPPYLEAKHMERRHPGLRDRLRRQVPGLAGAFDLYLAFCWRALDWVDADGVIALLVPGKVLVGRYAAAFRARVLDDGALVGLLDATRLRPRPFPGTGTYPVVLHLRPGRSAATFHARHAWTWDDLESPLAAAPAMPVAPLRRIGGERPLFAPFPDTWPDLEPLVGLPRFGDVARAVSACSFHRRGLRERFVGDLPDGDGVFPYLGGASYTRRLEVSPFRIAWAGHRIRYDSAALAALGNPLPDLRRTFLRPKLILVQHAARPIAVADPDGRYVTKDVYPVAWPTDPRWSLEALVAVVNSTVFAALYNTFHQGIVVGGETYHYLPAFLRVVPVPASPPDVDDAVRALHVGDGPVDGAAWDEVDRAVARAYGVSEAARRRMIDVHLRRVGAPAPQPAR